jgi:nucleotide-binding universal stress UspA family protein
MERIVVGVDGSVPSRNALRWAAREAKQNGATLQVVMTWEDLGPDMWIPHAPLGTDPLAVTRRALAGLVRAALGDHPAVAVEETAVEGNPARVLIEAAHNADLLVVGSRGHGGVMGTLLGSVSLQCVTHAPCPVVVVRGNVKMASAVARNDDRSFTSRRRADEELSRAGRGVGHMTTP